MQSSARLAAIIVVAYSFGCDRPEATEDLEPAVAKQVSPSRPDTGEAREVEEPAPPELPPSRVELFDTGLNLVKSTVLVPGGWTVHPDISTDPETAETHELVDYVGPDGELVRTVGVTPYFSTLGVNFSAAWPKLVEGALAGAVSDVKLGEPTPSHELLRIPTVAQIAAAMRIETWEVTVTGSQNGNAVSGIAYLVNVPVPENPDTGSFVTTIVISSEDRLGATSKAFLSIASSSKSNPAFDARHNEISRRVMQVRQAGDKQRLRDYRASPEADQQRARVRSRAFEQANAAWMKKLE